MIRTTRVVQTIFETGDGPVNAIVTIETSGNADAVATIEQTLARMNHIPDKPKVKQDMGKVVISPDCDDPPELKTWHNALQRKS